MASDNSIQALMGPPNANLDLDNSIRIVGNTPIEHLKDACYDSENLVVTDFNQPVAIVGTNRPQIFAEISEMLTDYNVTKNTVVLDSLSNELHFNPEEFVKFDIPEKAESLACDESWMAAHHCRRHNSQKPVNVGKARKRNSIAKASRRKNR